MSISIAPIVELVVWQKAVTSVVQLSERLGVPLARWSVRELPLLLEQQWVGE